MNCNLQSSIVNTYYTNYKFFFSKPNVEGIAYGYKYTKGLCTYEPCIHILVSKKIASNRLSPNTLIPSTYKGIKTDVIETGIFNGGCKTGPNNQISINPSAPLPYLTRTRPIQPGYCMSTSFDSPPEPFTGTFGYIVTDNEQVSKTYCLLSNNNTFANLNNASIGDSILQPSYTFNGRAPMDVVAKLLRFCPLKFSNNIPSTLEDFNVIDASIASYFNTGELQLLNPFIPNIGVPRGLGSPSLNLPMKWTGCVLGTQSGTISSVNAVIKVYYQNSKAAWFKDVFLSTGTSTFPDFGALACDKDLLAMGLVFATASFKLVSICNIKNVLDTLNINLLTV